MKRNKMDVWKTLNLSFLAAPLAYTWGRYGNFINGELWGRAADPSLPWAMAFPQSGSLIARHPSQLYEAGLEGALLFLILCVIMYLTRNLKLGTAAEEK